MATDGKRAVLIIAHKNFRDEELFETKEALEKGGVAVIIASSSMDTATGMGGAVVKPDILIGDINASDYDAVVFIGGGGAKEYFDDPTAHNLAWAATSSKKLLGAICIAPSILANAGLLAGKKATCFPSEATNLKLRGADFTGADIEIDENTITAEGPSSAEQFGQALAEALK